MKEKTILDNLSDEFDVKTEKSTGTITSLPKKAEEFRADILGELFQEVRKETTRTVAFVNIADYARAKMSEAKTEGLHIAISRVLDISSIKTMVKED